MHFGRVRFLDSSAAVGDLPFQPGQASLDHVQLEGPHHAARLLANAQVSYRRPREKKKSISTILHLVFLLSFRGNWAGPGVFRKIMHLGMSK